MPEFQIITQLRYKMRIIIHRMRRFGVGIVIFNKESIDEDFGRAPQGRGAPLWLLSLLNTIILCLHIWILCIITSISRLFGMILQIMEIIPYLSYLSLFRWLMKFTNFAATGATFRRIFSDLRLESCFSPHWETELL